MEFDVRVARHAAEVGQDEWDALARGLPFASYLWHQFAETVRTEDRPLYLVLSTGGEPVALATFWLTYREQIPLSSPLARRLAAALLRQRPALICQLPFVFQPGLLLPDDGELRDAALRALIPAARDAARECGASFLTFSYLSPQQARAPAWPRPAIVHTGGSPGTRLDLRWSSFDDYLRSLSRKTRERLRHHEREAAARGLTVTCSPAVTDIAEALPLIRNVERRYRADSHPWIDRLLAHAACVDTVWTTVRLDGALAGCALMLGDGGTWFATGLGHRYDVPDVYFLMQYANLRWAIEHGARTLRWGSEAYDVKARYGFTAEENTSLVAYAAGPAWWVRAVNGFARRAG